MATAAPKEELNPFEIAKQQFDRAADYLELEQSLRNVLRSAKRQLIVSIPVKMDKHYFGLVADDQFFDRMLQSRTIAIYIPTALPDATIELMAVMKR